MKELTIARSDYPSERAEKISANFITASNGLIFVVWGTGAKNKNLSCISRNCCFKGSLDLVFFDAAETDRSVDDCSWRFERYQIDYLRPQCHHIKQLVMTILDSEDLLPYSSAAEAAADFSCCICWHRQEGP